MKIKYIGGGDSVDAAGFTFERGVAVDVPDEIAGRPPAPRLAEAMAELQVARVGGDHQWQRDLRLEIAGDDTTPGLDPGEGLLASDLFVAVDAKKSDKPKEDAK